MLAYSLFTIASLHVAADGVARAAPAPRRRCRASLQALPPLLDAGALLFRIIGAGFVLLTLTLASGIAVLRGAVRQARCASTTRRCSGPVVAHLRRAARRPRRYGWRGRTALRWTLAGFLMLVLAYIGSQLRARSPARPRLTAWNVLARCDRLLIAAERRCSPCRRSRCSTARQPTARSTLRQARRPPRRRGAEAARATRPRFLSHHPDRHHLDRPAERHRRRGGARRRRSPRGCGAVRPDAKTSGWSPPASSWSRSPTSRSSSARSCPRPRRSTTRRASRGWSPSRCARSPMRRRRSCTCCRLDQRVRAGRCCGCCASRPQEADGAAAVAGGDPHHRARVVELPAEEARLDPAQPVRPRRDDGAGHHGAAHADRVDQARRRHGDDRRTSSPPRYHQRLPVFRERAGDVVGVLHLRKVLGRAARRARSTTQALLEVAARALLRAGRARRCSRSCSTSRRTRSASRWWSTSTAS